MFPDRKTALQELAKAEELNPGPWGQHSRNVAHAAELIAGRCDKMDSDKAFVCGLLHDIGRRTGVAAVRHIIDGYDYAAARGWTCRRQWFLHLGKKIHRHNKALWNIPVFHRPVE